MTATCPDMVPPSAHASPEVLDIALRRAGISTSILLVDGQRPALIFEASVFGGLRTEPDAFAAVAEMTRRFERSKRFRRDSFAHLYGEERVYFIDDAGKVVLAAGNTPVPVPLD